MFIMPGEPGNFLLGRHTCPGDFEMRTHHVLLMGGVGIAASLIASNNDLNIIGLFAIAVGMLFLSLFDRNGNYVEYYGWTWLGRNLVPIALTILTVSFIMMPFDGSVVFGALSLALAAVSFFGTAIAIYAQNARAGERIVWKDVRRMAIPIGLPAIGLVLNHGLIMADLSAVPGCIILVVLTWVGTMLVPHGPFVRLPMIRDQDKVPA